MTTVTNYIQEVELYLEGVKIPTFNSVTISEQENVIPAAQIVFAADNKVLRILPGTIVQVFIKMKTPAMADTENPTEVSNSFLIFEGQITTINYSKGVSNEVVAFNAISLLSETARATLRPGHALITTARNDAELNHIVKVRLSNDLEYNGRDVFGKNSTVNKDKNNPPTKGEGYYEGTLNQLKEIATFGDIANSMANAFKTKDTEMSKGNHLEYLKEMNRFFMQSDLYYGIQSIAYKLGQSIFSFPNKASGFDLKVALVAMNNVISTMNQYPTGTDAVHILMNLIEEFKKFLGYKYICPASLIPAKYFHVVNDSSGAMRPLRMIFMPDFESGPPPLCNIFYPEQVTSLNFSRDFMSEPTRVIGQLTYSFLDGAIPGNMMPITVVPDVNVHHPEDGSGKTISSKYTDEESYRGVVLKVAQHDGVTIRALYDHKSLTTTGDKSKIEPLNETDKKDIEPGLRKFVLNDYLNMKYGQRMVQINTEYNPYRIIGLPAMVFEKGKPTIIGIIYSMTTQISATGQAMTSCALRNARLFFDESDADSSTFLKDPGSIKDENDSLSSYVVSDFVNSGCLGANPLMYEPDYYGMENIGKELYPYLMVGKLGKRNLYKFFKEKTKKPYPVERACIEGKEVTHAEKAFVINYDTDKYHIKGIKTVEPKAQEIVKQLTSFINNEKPITIYVDGFTDWCGTTEYNVGLGKRRATWAKDYLSPYFPEATFVVNWYGEDPKYFVGDNKTDEGRAANRRTEIRIVKGEAEFKDYSIVRYVDLNDFRRRQLVEGKYDSLEVYNTKLLYEAIRNFKNGYYKENNFANSLNVNYRRLIKKQEYLDSISSLLELDDYTANNWVANSKDLQHILQQKDLSYSKITQLIVDLDDILNNDDIAKNSYSNPEDEKELSKPDKDKLIEAITKEIKVVEARIKKLKTEIEKKKNASGYAGEPLNEDIALDVANTELEDLKQKKLDVENGIINKIDDSEKIHKLINSILVAPMTKSTAKSVRETSSIFRPYNTTRRAHVQNMVNSYNYLKLQVLNENEVSNIIVSK